MKTAGFLVALLLSPALVGCRAHMVTIRLTNTSAEPISTIIVDYPSATFGKDKLAPGETFSSPVKLIDTGAIKVQFTDARGASHSYIGPIVHPNSEGTIEIKFDQHGAVVEANVTSH